VANQKNLGALPGAGNVTTIQNVLEYTWKGVDTNFVYRGPAGIRISGGTSIGRSLRNTCRVDGDIGLVSGVRVNRTRGVKATSMGAAATSSTPTS
jgi:hypothetical protein